MSIRPLQRNTKKHGYNFLVFVIGCILAFVTAEVILRIHNPFAFRVKGNKIVLSANEEYVIKNEKAPKLDKSITFRTNSLGFRGNEPPGDFDDYLTTVTVGGSTTECSVLSEGKTWTDVLGKRLENYYNKVWINNAGLDGHSTFGHIVLMEDYISKLKPKNVLFLIGINDEGNNEGQRDFQDDKTIMKNKIYLKSIKGLGRTLSNYSEFFAVLLNLYRYYQAYVVGVEHNTELDLNSSLILELPDNIKQQAIKKHTQFLPSYEERLKKLISITRNSGIEPIFITQPALYGNAVDDIKNIDLAKIKKRNNVNGELAWERLELYNDVVRHIGDKEHVFVIDLAKKMPKSSKYYYDFSHFTNEGAEKVAEIIVEDLCPFYKKKYRRFLKKDCDSINFEHRENKVISSV